MKALVICEQLLDVIKNRKITKGFVHSVFSGACNLEAGNNFITLLSRNKYMASMGMLVDNGKQLDFKQLGLIPGAEFKFDEEYITCRERGIFIDLKGAETYNSWVLEGFTACSKEKLQSNIKIFEQGLSDYGKLDGMGILMHGISKSLPILELRSFYSFRSDICLEFIEHRLCSFLKSMLKGDFEAAADYAKGIIGFGPGLTPAADDFISGLMLSRIYFGNVYGLDIPRILESNNKIIGTSLAGTTRVSSEMLKHSAKGEANSAVKVLLNKLTCNSNEKIIISALVNTIGFGETSGTDTALGIYTGYKLLNKICMGGCA